MRYILLLIVGVLLLFSCDFNSSKKTQDNAQPGSNSPKDVEALMQRRMATTDDYSEALDQLDQGTLASLDVAKVLLVNSKADTLTRDSMFVFFNDFYNRLAGSYLENNETVSSLLENSPSEEVLTRLKSTFAPYGILLSVTGGEYSLEPQTEYLLQNFGGTLSPAYREYLTLEEKEQKGRFAVNGTILIPADSLAARIITWENFLERYPGFVSCKQAQDQYAQYLGAYLAGMDNSRVFDAMSNRLTDSSKVAFETFIANHPQGKSSEIVKAYLDLLHTTNFNYTDKVDSFLLEKVYH